MAAPTLVSTNNSAWNTTTTPKTVSVTTQAGDRLVVLGSSADAQRTLGTPTGNGVTYSLAQSVTFAGHCTAYVWSGTDATGGTSWTMSITAAGTSLPWGFMCLVFRDSDGFGASGQDTGNVEAPLLAITTTQANSALAVIDSDWNAVDGTTRTWRTINGITPTAGNGGEKNYFRDAAQYTTYAAVWSDAGSIGSVNTGLTAPSTQYYSMVAIEVRGSTAAPQGAPRAALVCPSAAVTQGATW